MAAIAITDGTAGLASVPLVAANGGGDTIAAGSRGGGWDLAVVLVVRNADATTTTVTVDGTPYVVPATTGLALIPVFAIRYGMVKAVTYSKVTSLTVGAVKLSPSDLVP